MLDPAALSQGLTLLFIGTISTLSIRAFLKNASRIFATLTSAGRWLGLGRSGGGQGSGGAAVAAAAGAGGGVLLALGQLAGAYAISSLLLLRRNVPVAHRAAIDNVLGGELEFQYFHR